MNTEIVSCYRLMKSPYTGVHAAWRTGHDIRFAQLLALELRAMASFSSWPPMYDYWIIEVFDKSVDRRRTGQRPLD